jgi:crotonobetainyl-CoA hydratase
MELMLTGRRMGAIEAAHWGLVNAVVSSATLMDKAREWAMTIAEGRLSRWKHCSKQSQR